MLGCGFGVALALLGLASFNFGVSFSFSFLSTGRSLVDVFPVGVLEKKPRMEDWFLDPTLLP